MVCQGWFFPKRSPRSSTPREECISTHNKVYRTWNVCTVRFQKRDRHGEASMALLAGPLCGVHSSSQKHNHAKNSHWMAPANQSRGEDMFFAQDFWVIKTRTRATKRFKTGDNVRASDDSSGIAASAGADKASSGPVLKMTGRSFLQWIRSQPLCRVPRSTLLLLQEDA